MIQPSQKNLLDGSKDAAYAAGTQSNDPAPRGVRGFLRPRFAPISSRPQAL